jgi:hypothetical protein
MTQANEVMETLAAIPYLTLQQPAIERCRIPQLLLSLKELHGALVLFSGSASVERAQVSALAGLWVLLA